MKRSSESSFVPVIIIALGAVAMAVGTVLVALHEQQRLRREIGDAAVEDTAEIDATPDDIAAANEVVDEIDEPIIRTEQGEDEPVDFPSAAAAVSAGDVEALPDTLPVPVPEVNSEDEAVPLLQS